MDSIAAQLANDLVTQLKEIPTSRRLLVGITGIPASGKSTFAVTVAKGLAHALGGSSAQTAILVGLDGWHFTRAELDAMPDPKLAHDKRGAHWTFDGPTYVKFVRALREGITPTTSGIPAPSFDHAVKDPIPDDIVVQPWHRIIIIEGLYTCLSIDPWIEASRLLDERWLIRVGAIKARERLVRRHVLTGVAKDMEEAIWRATENDDINGKFLIDNMVEPTKVIISVDDPSLAPLTQ